MFVQMTPAKRQNILLPKVGMMMQHYEPKCHAGGKGAIFKVKVTARSHVVKIWLFLLYHLNNMCMLLIIRWYGDAAS